MNAVLPAPTFSRTWRATLAALAAIELALIALYHDTALAMAEIWWRSETFNHAFLVPPIALWLIWEKRAALARIRPTPLPWIAVPLAGLAFAWLLGELAAVNAVTQFAFVAMLVLAVPLIVGLPAARVIAFPLCFLFFAVPFGEFVMPKLMEWTAAFTVMGLRASGIPVYQEGLHFVIPSGRWSVVEACSGVRYLIASVVVGALYAYLNYQSLKRRLIFVGVSILVPLVANWVRAYLIVILGHLSGNTLAVGVDHLIYGWLFFGVVMMIMFAIGLRWREFEKPVPVPVAEAGDSASPPPHASRLAVAMVLALAIVAAPRGALHVLDGGPALPPPELDSRSLAAGGWQASAEVLADWTPAFTNPSVTLGATLQKDGRHVGIFVAWYWQQGYDSKLISSENVLVKSGDPAWALSGREWRQTRIGGQEATLHSSQLRGSPSSLGSEPPRLRVWHWYWIGGRLTTSDHLGKLWLALDRMSGRGDESAAVFVYAPEDQPGGADAALAAYLEQAGDGIEAMLGQAAGTAKR